MAMLSFNDAVRSCTTAAFRAIPSGEGSELTTTYWCCPSRAAGLLRLLVWQPRRKIKRDVALLRGQRGQSSMTFGMRRWDIQEIVAVGAAEVY